MGGLAAYDIYTKFKAGSGSSVSESGLAAYHLMEKHAEPESRVNGLIQKMMGRGGGCGGRGAVEACDLATMTLDRW